MKNRIFLITFLLAAFAIGFTSCNKNEEEEETIPTLAEEQALLNQYLSALTENGQDVDTTANGVYYIEVEAGTGATVQEGDEISVAFSGYFIGSSLPFYTTGNPELYGYYTYKHKVADMIPGWEEGIETIKKGGTTLLIVPSWLAYGDKGFGTIRPYTTVLYQINVHDIVPATPSE